MTERSAASSPRRRDESPGASIRSAYLRLRLLGLSEPEAGSLTAHIAGLAPARAGWELREVERLLFLRALVDTGRLDP